MRTAIMILAAIAAMLTSPMGQDAAGTLIDVPARGGASAPAMESSRAEAPVCHMDVAVAGMPGMEHVGVFRRTFYGTVPGVTGDVGASGRELFDGAVALNPADMAAMGVGYGDELCLVRPDGSEVWCVVLDAAAASGIVDCYVPDGQEIPAFGAEAVEVWAKRVAE
jgi:hypothetical protein